MLVSITERDERLRFTKFDSDAIAVVMEAMEA